MDPSIKAKMFIGMLSAMLWIAAIVAKHFWPDIDIAAFTSTCVSVIAGTGAYHAASIAGASAPDKNGQGGFAMSGLLLTIVAVVSATLAVTGCASLTYAGDASYEVKANGAQGYDLSIKDGKEYTGDGRTIMFRAEDGTLVVQEGPSKAFKGQAISAKALSLFPITDLANIIGK